MAKQLQLRRGTKAQNDAFTGAVGELSVDTENHKLRLHDGSTQGGHVIDSMPSQTGNSGKFLTTNGTSASWDAVPSDDTKLDKSGGTMTGNLTLGDGESSELWDYSTEVNSEYGAMRFGLKKDGTMRHVDFKHPTISKGFSLRLEDLSEGQWADAEGVIESGTNYVRYSSGLQMCWGDGTTQSNNIGAVSFGASFINIPSITGIATDDTPLDYSFLRRTVSTSAFTFLCNYNGASRSGIGVSWIAIGRWK